MTATGWTESRPSTMALRSSRHIAESDECQLKTGVHYVALADAGERNDYSLGCIIFVGW
jgi:hypothetical protein